MAGNWQPRQGRPDPQGIARLNADGSLDGSFGVGAGPNAAVLAMASQTDGKVVVGGLFTTFNGVTRNGLARLNTDGTLDTAFQADVTFGPNNPVMALALQGDGKIGAGGDFSAVNGVARNALIRLNADGSPDTAFDAGAGAGYTDFNPPTVFNVALQPTGDVVFVGSFFNFNGTACTPGVARVGAGGGLDAAVDGSVGPLDAVYALAVQTDGKFLTANYLRDADGDPSDFPIARLNTDGSLDTNFDPGSGTNAVVRAVTLQPDGKTLLGGDFSTVDGIERDAAARLLGDYDLNAYPALGQWRIINFGQPAATGRAADTAMPYGDGVPNLLKYALDLNPQAPDATPMTATGAKGLPLVGRDASGRYLTLTFVRRQAVTAPGVTYIVEFAGSLASPTGFAVNQAATSTVTTLDATWERVTVTDSVPVSSQTLSRFVRLRLTDP